MGSMVSRIGPQTFEITAKRRSVPKTQKIRSERRYWVTVKVTIDHCDLEELLLCSAWWFLPSG